MCTIFAILAGSSPPGWRLLVGLASWATVSHRGNPSIRSTLAVYGRPGAILLERTASITLVNLRDVIPN